MHSLVTLATLVALFALPASADEKRSRPDEHAPIGVMGDHMHKKGELMVSYRYARMRMDGNRSATVSQSVEDVFADGTAGGMPMRFVISPTDMDMEMHMIGGMWAPTDWLTLMGMLPFVVLGMDHENIDGDTFRTGSSGLGDIKLGGLLQLWEQGPHDVHLNVGFSFPSGPINRADDVNPPGGASSVRTQLPYPMQLGSGSYDFIPGATYTGTSERLSWGAQALGTIRLNENDRDYKLGDRVDLTTWIAYPWTRWLSTSVRVSWHWWDNIRGADPELNPAVVPTARPDLRGGWRLDFLPGINLLTSKGHRFAFEFGVPMAQWLSGPQLETDWRLMVGYQKAFGPFEAIGF